MPPNTAENTTEASTLPPPGQSSTPKTLLWSFQLARENKIMADALRDVKNQLADTQDFAQTLKKCLDELLDTVHSLAHIFDSESKTDDDKHQLLLLHRHLQHTLEPLCKYGRTLVLKNKKMVQCIAALEGLEDLSRYRSADVEVTTSGPSTPCPKPKSEVTGPFFSATTSPVPTTAYSTPSKAKDKPATHQKHQPERKDPMDALFAQILQQRNRPLETYFDEASAYRRDHRPLTPNVENALVKAFIAGCDDKLYRRRLTHSLRKKEFNWTWLMYEVQFLILEEEYMEKQKYALAHQNEDGSVLWPDGSTRTRFVSLAPVTEDDLTSSDGEY